MKTIGKILALALTGATLALGSGAIAQEKTWTKVRIATEGAFAPGISPSRTERSTASRSTSTRISASA